MKVYLFSAILFLTLLFGYRCNTQNNPVTSGSDVYFPQIENDWRDAKNDEHSFSFSTDDTDVSFGIFSGLETIPNPFEQAELNGAFNNRDVEFIIKRQSGEIKYKGRFTNDATMQLISTNKDSLILIKHVF